MKVALDNHYAPVIAAKLRERGHDAVAAIDQGWDALDDEALLEACASERRALLTNDVADFSSIARLWATEGRRHAGMIFTSDASMPRGRATIGRFVTALDRLLRGNPKTDAFSDRIHWL